MKKKTGLTLAILVAGSMLLAAEDLFPEIRGWKLNRDNVVYNSDNLWELIDGAAELYLAYDFQDLHLATYSGRKGREVRVELYRHSTPEDTYGIYTAERMPDYSLIEMGVQGYTSPGILHFFTGHYCIKVLSAGSADVDEATLKVIAGRVSSGLGQTGSWPEEVGLFPETGKVAMSDAYFASNFMGYSFLQSAFTARYDAAGEFTLFIMHGKAGEAKNMLDKYLGQFKEDKTEQLENITVVQDPFNGKVYLFPCGDYLVGAMNAANEKAALEHLRTMAEAIEKRY